MFSSFLEIDVSKKGLHVKTLLWYVSVCDKSNSGVQILASAYMLVLTGHHCKPHACVKCFLKGFVEWNKWWEPCTEVGFRLHGSTN